MKPTPLVIQPKGARWPWYPEFRTEIMLPDPPSVALSLSLSSIGEVTKHHVGIRACLKHHWRAVRAIDAEEQL